jgi:hypothetical protein
VPEATLWANPQSIKVGDTSILGWKTSGAATVVLEGKGVAPVGSTAVTPWDTTTYHLVASDAAHLERTSEVTISVLGNTVFEIRIVGHTNTSISFTVKNPNISLRSIGYWAGCRFNGAHGVVEEHEWPPLAPGATQAMVAHGQVEPGAWTGCYVRAKDGKELTGESQRF